MKLYEIDNKTTVKSGKSKLIVTENRSPSRILMELNVINIADIDSYLVGISKNAPAQTKKWFLSRAKKYLINSDEDNELVTRFSSKAEPWMQKRHEEGVQLYTFRPSGKLTNQLSHVIDWLIALNDVSTGNRPTDVTTKNNATKSLRGINNMNISQAIDKSVDWTRQLQKETKHKITVKDEPGLEFILSAGDYAWYELTDQLCLDNEGNRMGHCVGSYGNRVSSGNIKIYSLRDINNMPHATIEVNEGKITQIKGKENQPPVSKYKSAVLQMVKHLGVPFGDAGMYDGRKIGIELDPRDEKYKDIRNIGNSLYSSGNDELRRVASKNRFGNYMPQMEIR
jgi:hypothetical protein